MAGHTSSEQKVSARGRSAADHHGQRTITRKLADWYDGDDDALKDVIGGIYRNLRRQAGFCLGNEKMGHTLQPTALLNELYLKLVTLKEMRFESRAHFINFAGKLMRQILVEYARARLRQKRGGGNRPAALEAVPEPAREEGLDLASILGLDEALAQLKEMDPRQHQIVELHFFAGLSLAEIAQIMSLSLSTIKREWQVAKCWLALKLKRPLAQEKK